MNPTTRRRFLELAPIAGTALVAACSPSPSPAPSPAAASPAPSTPAPAPAAAAAPAPSASPAPAPSSGSSAPAGAPSAAADAPMVDEKEPQAVALKYVNDASKVDKAAAPNYVAGSHCGNCALYQGGDAPAGPCPLFAGKRVANAGWCQSWVKKA